MRKKGDLPRKICIACGRSFVWRRKWRDIWDDVMVCSKRCRSDRKRQSNGV